ncbi:PFAM N-6 DNA methylase [Halomonadaceae bacterium LMG 33818]|uniref:HsdM family class I SAM-dependent methyltransferase n=1 Tax=Cernens ardua TaxID=3402176 RepID=UPI003EDB7BFD
MSDHTIKGLRAQFKATGKFHTPPELALFLRSLIPGTPRDVYDPTCGAGALLSVFDDCIPKYGQDIDSGALNDAAMIPNMHTAYGDVLEEAAYMDKRFHAIVANPPFGIKWRPHEDERFDAMPCIPTQGRADYAFIGHIIHMLAEDGVAAVLCSTGILFRSGREQQIRRWMIEQNLIDQVISIPGNTFPDTSIATACIVIRKDRSATSITFHDRANNLTREVELSEVASNDYGLLVSNYVQPELEAPEEVDLHAVQRSVMSSAVKNIKAELELQKIICELEGKDFYPHWKQMRNAVDEMRPARTINDEQQMELVIGE